MLQDIHGADALHAHYIRTAFSPVSEALPSHSILPASMHTCGVHHTDVTTSTNSKLVCGARPQVGIRGEMRFRRCGSEVGVAMLAPSSPTDDSAESMLLGASVCARGCIRIENSTCVIKNCPITIHKLVLHCVPLFKRLTG